MATLLAFVPLAAYTVRAVVRAPDPDGVKGFADCLATSFGNVIMV